MEIVMRTLILTGLVFIFIAATPCTEPSALAATSGEWNGYTNQGYKIEFDVSGNKIKDIHITVFFSGAQYGAEILYDDVVNIEGNAFTFVFDWDIGWAESATINGSFVNNARCTGTWTVNLDGELATGTWLAAVDSDLDGYPDDEDDFPNDINEWLDTDGDGIGNNRDTDDDNDGMPDDWEEVYDLNPLVDDAMVDADGDGAINLREYLRGTDPKDPESYPSVAMPWIPLLLLND